MCTVRRRSRLEHGEHQHIGVIGEKRSYRERDGASGDERQGFKEERGNSCHMQEEGQVRQWKEPTQFSNIDDHRAVSSSSMVWVDDIYPFSSLWHLTHCSFSSQLVWRHKNAGQEFHGPCCKGPWLGRDKSELLMLFRRSAVVTRRCMWRCFVGWAKDPLETFTDCGHNLYYFIERVWPGS